MANETVLQGNANWYADHLRTVSASDWARSYRARSFELIGLKSGGRFLDIGCGLGDDAIAMAASVGSDGRVVAIDIDPGLLERATARATSGNVTFHRADAHALPFSSGSFDGARIDRVLQHAGQPERAIGEMARVLRAGGRGAAIEPDWGTYAVDLPDRALVRRVLDARTDAYADGWVGRRLYRLFRAAGFQDVWSSHSTQ